MPESEAGEAGLVGRLSFLHQTVCLLCGPSLPGFDYSGRSRRTAPGLEDGQGFGDAVHARAVAPSGDSRAEGDWHRRGFDSQRSRLPHCGERFGEAPAHLVWGKDRSEASMDLFFAWLGPKKSKGIRLAVMDMWKPFRNSTRRNAPQAAILFDKFHIMRHLGEALDAVRKREYARLSGKKREFIKGQKYTLLSHRENLNLDGRDGLEEIAEGQQAVEHGLSSQGVLWSTLGLPERRLGAEIFRKLACSLKWQRLKPYEEFAQMIDTHWDGIAAFCKPENKVSLGFVEGLNNKIRVIQRRAYGLRDEEYLRLKVLTCMLPTR